MIAMSRPIGLEPCGRAAQANWSRAMRAATGPDTSEKSLTGPGQAPQSGGPAKQLVVLLHGLGADGNDLIGLAPNWAAALPDAAFIAPDGPMACDMGPFGRQWFSLQEFRSEERRVGKECRSRWSPYH